MRRASKVDCNQAEIVRALRDIGASVLDLSAVGNGCPDLLVLCMGKLFLLEVKNPEQDWSYTKDQRTFHLLWGAAIHTVTSVDEAFKAVGINYRSIERI